MVLEPATRPGEALGDQQAAARPEDAAQLGQAGGRVAPVVEGGDRPGDRGLAALQREPLGGAVGHADGVPQRAGVRQVASRRICDDGSTPTAVAPRSAASRRNRPGRTPRPPPGPPAHLRQLGDEPRAPPPPERHRQPTEQPQEPLELGPVAVAVAHMPLLMVCALLLVIDAFAAMPFSSRRRRPAGPGPVLHGPPGAPTHRPH